MIKSFARYFITSLLIFFSALIFISCSGSKRQPVKPSGEITKLGTTDTIFLENAYISQSLDFALYDAWIVLDDALSLLESNKSQEAVATAQNNFLRELEREKHLKTYNISRGMYGIQNQLEDMKKACLEKDRMELSRLVTAFYISKGLIYQKSGTIFMQLLVLMSILILIVMALLFFYQFTYARKLEIEKILKATNKGQEEERRRIALELHDSVAQQMRYVSILAEKIPDEELSKEIKTNQSQCVENIRNACYILSSINMDKGSFPAALKNSVDAFQKRTGISTSLIITDDADFDSVPKDNFHHLFRIIMELLTNIEKHAQAEEVTVLIRNPSASDKIKKGLLIFITDDGQGIDPKLLEMMNSKKTLSIKNMHFGLKNIKLRLNEINGSIRFFSEPGEGTEVEIRMGK